VSTLETSAKYLSEAGLRVKVVSPKRLYVDREGDRVIDLEKTDAGYEVSSWEYAPGPGEEDFLLAVPALDEALLMTWCYYFSRDVEIAGWKLALHRRPYWSLPKLQYRLANAAHVSSDQLAAIKESRCQRALSDPKKKPFGLAFAEFTQFIVAGKHSESGALLLLRRDMEEAYVVAADA
jgi:hypothetical protein